jgi:hypothetical protein
VLTTFTTNDLRRLRILAILSKIGFITYGLSAALPPVFGLHLLLLPLNVVRLIELGRTAMPCVRRDPRGPYRACRGFGSAPSASTVFGRSNHGTERRSDC